jgi:hypothetical protein
VLPFWSQREVLPSVQELSAALLLALLDASCNVCWSPASGFCEPEYARLHFGSFPCDRLEWSFGRVPMDVPPERPPFRALSLVDVFRRPQDWGSVLRNARSSQSYRHGLSPPRQLDVRALD